MSLGNWDHAEANTHKKAKKQNDMEGMSGPWLLGKRRVVFSKFLVACGNRLVSSKHMHKSQKDFHNF